MTILTDKPKIISERLKTIAQKVCGCERLIDVGTDHALLPIYCINYSYCKTAIALDIREGPLHKARINIKKARLENFIQTIKTDGLEGLEIFEDDCVVISGIGGYEIISILNQKVINSKKIILSPHKSAFELRSYLNESGYVIKDETVVFERDKYYTIMQVVYNPQSIIKKDDEIIYNSYIGENIIKKVHKTNDELIRGYLLYLKKKLSFQVKGDKRLQVVIEKINELLDKE